MRPPTRSTRSVRPPSNTNNARRSRGASGLHIQDGASPSEAINTPHQPKLKSKLQSTIAATAATPADAKVNPGTSPGSDPALAPVISCFPVLPPATFIFENHGQSHGLPESLPIVCPSVAGSVVLGKPPRSRQRLSSDKLETLEAFFRRNTHPSRKEKEIICKDLDMDLKTVTIWFQNKRQTVARSRRQLGSEGATNPTAAMDMLASASATMSPLVATVKPSASLASTAVQLGTGVQSSYPGSLSLSQPSSLSLRASSCDSISNSRLTQRRVPLSAVAHDPNVLVFESVRTEILSPTSGSSPSPDLRRPLEGDWSIHPEDLWKHIPSSPAQAALSSPNASPDIDTPSRSSRLLVQRPRTLEWACAQSAKRRRTNPDAIYHEDEESEGECNPKDDPGACCSSFSVSEARVPLECYDRYPLDVIRGAVLLLGLRDAVGDVEL